MRQLAALVLLTACGGGEFDSRALVETGGEAGSGGATGGSAPLNIAGESGSAGEAGAPGVEPGCETFDQCIEPCDGGTCVTYECPMAGTACLHVSPREKSLCNEWDYGGAGSYACLPECDPQDPRLYETCHSNICCRVRDSGGSVTNEFVCVPVGWEARAGCSG